MAETDEFAHGTYGDYSGVVFYGPPEDGLWTDRLAVSSRYLGPLFHAILTRARLSGERGEVPKLVQEWNEVEGWADATAIVPVALADAEELIDALSKVAASDVAEHCAGATPEQCLRCASVISRFLGSRIARRVYIEAD